MTRTPPPQNDTVFFLLFFSSFFYQPFSFRPLLLGLLRFYGRVSVSTCLCEDEGVDERCVRSALSFGASLFPALSRRSLVDSSPLRPWRLRSWARVSGCGPSTGPTVLGSGPGAAGVSSHLGLESHGDRTLSTKDWDSFAVVLSEVNHL